MNGGILPALLLSATIGLLLSFATRRTALLGFAAMSGTASLVALLTLPASLAVLIFIATWSTIIVAAGLTYFPPAKAERWAIPIALAAGAGIGGLTAISGRKIDLLLALPVGLLFVPGRWLVGRGLGLGVKVVASWMVAIALLSAFVSLTPTPGYQPDHKE